MKRYPSILTTLILMLGFAISLYAPPTAAAADVGYEDFLFGTPGTSCNVAATGPTGEKPESKLWWNAGKWWASMCAPNNTYHIYKLNLSNQTWQDTGTALDNRPNSRADILWDANTNKLYVASHVFAKDGAASPNPSDWGRLYRYSYNAGIYSLDAGFPVNVTAGVEEAMVLAKDSTGRLWVTYVESQKVMINHSSGSDTNWGTPKVLNVPAGATNLAKDDIASIIAFDVTTANPKIGVLWSNQNDKKMYFAVHQDSNSNDQAWTSFGIYNPSTGSPDAADDHMNIKLQSDGRGVFAVIKTSNTMPAQPLVVLLACTASCSSAGSWQAYTVYTKSENHTRAILLIDTDNNKLNIFTNRGAAIYRKTSAISNISFAPGHGELFIQLAADPKINDPTSTKDNVNSTTGLVVLASDLTTGRYVHGYDALGGGPPAPVADFSATPTAGAAPLLVTFSDQSSGTPTSWSWDFDNDGTTDSSSQNPSFTYNTPGSYTVKLTVANANGSDTKTRTGYITVSNPPPVADFSATPTAGAAPLLVTFSDQSSGTPTSWSWDFDNDGTTNSSSQNPSFTYNTPGSYTVKLTVANANGSDTKTRTGYITVSNPPPVADFSATPTAGAAPLLVTFSDQSSGTPTSWSWDFDNDGTTDSSSQNPSFTYNTPGSYTVKLTVANANGSDTKTRTGYITVSNPPPVADFSATPTAGAAPLLVTFSDQSSGTPTSWSWDFDNDGTTDSSSQNPSFTYNTPGSYTVKLTVANATGSDTKIRTGYITVGTPPVADFSATPTAGAAPLLVTFSDQSSGTPTSWSWDFDNDGTTDSSSQNPSFTYNTPGSYTVKLTVANATGSDTKIRTGYITVGTPPPDAIFADGFEAGNFSAWSASTTDGGDLNATASAALIGATGMQAVIDDNIAIFVTDDQPLAEPRYRARFYFDPNSITMASGDAHYLFYGLAGTSTAVVRVELRFSNGAYQLRSALLNDSTTWTNSSWVTISDAAHFIELDWRAATAVGANDGGLTLWIDGAQQANLTGVDNDTRRIDTIRLGAVAGIDSTTRGTYYFDAFVSRRQTYIGPDPNVPPPPDTIFADGFEAGNFSAWSASTTDGGDLSATAGAALIGTTGMQALIDDNIAIFVTDDQPLAEPRYRARFYFDPNSITMASGDAHYLFYGLAGTSTAVVRVELRFSNGAYQLRSALLNDSTTWTSSSWVTISDAAHFIELDWRAATAVGANDGGLTLWIDGAQQANLTGVDNDTRRIDTIRLGAVAGIDSTTRGMYYFDAFVSRRQTYIGP